MTRVEFYFNVDDKIAKAVDLCEKSLAKNHQITVFSPQKTVNVDLQSQLWTKSDTSFLPNHEAAHAHLAHTPIQLHDTADSLLQDDVLINFDENVPMFFGRFRTLIELVGQAEADKVAARVRFAFYRDRGYEIKATNLAE